ncbi:hypothetical protein KP509_1Z241400 [Ceratopteris richardii]|nr:hypothetical protein KP509_1Z241400 [Ceratopteris richardii]
MQRNTKKFQLSAIFNSSATATKVRTIDVLVNEDGNCIIDKWLVILSFGYGQTKTLALDRRFLAYNLSPVAGVAVLVSRNGLQSSLLHKSVVLCPLPLSICFGLPVVILGCFIVSHDGNRHLFQSSSEAFKYEASSMSLYRSSSEIPPATRRNLSKQSYILWPTPQKLRLASLEVEEMNRENLETNWLLKYLIRPMIVRLADLPVWKLHGGYFARATEGMFLSNPNTELNSFQLPDAVCEFLKEHYKVFAVPYELTEALQDAQVRIKIITPRMIRYLLRTSPAVPKFSGVDNYVELLDYSCSDFGSVLEEKVAIAESSGTSAIPGDVKYSDASVMSPGEELSLLRDQGSAELPLLGREPSAIMNNFRRAMTQIGKTVEELSIEASQRFITQRQVSEASQQSDSSNNLDKWINEVKGLPCPAANNSVHRIGRIELLLGSTEQQELLVPLSAKFIHTKCMDRPLLSRIFENSSVQSALKIKPFTANVLSDSMASVLPREWCEGAFHWVEWNKNARLKSPTVEWLLLFWKHVFVLTDNLTLFQQWPLVPASLGVEILVKLQYSHLIFMPPLLESDIESRMSTTGSIEEHIETRPSRAIERSYAKVKENHPWLIPFLQYCNVPVFDENFIDSNVVKTCCPTEGQTLCYLVRSKLLAAKESGNLVASQMKVMSSDCDALFSLFAEECNSAASVSSNFTTTEIEFMRSLPIYRTVLGSYTSLDLSIHCIVAPTAFFKPQSDLCLQYYAPEEGGAYYNKLGVQELSDSEILVKFCLPFFGALTTEDQEQTLAHVYAHWESLQYNDGVLNALTHTRFVRNKSGEDGVLFQPHELLDPTVSLFKEVFKERPERFPDTKFMSNRWLAILRKAGLHSTLDAESLLGCAKEVENMGRWGSFSDLQSDNFKEISEETFIIAGKVVEAILANLAALYGSSFFQPLSEIAFVPTTMGIPSRYGNAGTRVLSCYKQLVLLKDWPLAWTSSPILTNPNLVPPEFSWHSLQLKSPPQLPVVLKHIQEYTMGKTFLLGGPLVMI